MLIIDFLYYDKAACRRCASTNRSVRQTLQELKAADQTMKLRETKLPESKIHLSPSILINGKDIESMVNRRKTPASNECADCCRMVGRPVNCRSFTYKGRKYDYIPKGMIKEAIKRVKK